jgi:peptidoglycan/LPS O-acetylase OafA/YrhL
MPNASPISNRIPELDGLRGVAILLVLFYHYFQSAPLPRFVATLGSLSWSGVDLFFVLSGFLLGGILLDAKTSPAYFKTFYARRAFRILPVYALTCLAFWIGSVFAAKTADNQALTWLLAHPLPWQTYVTFTQNFSMTYYGTLGAAWLGATWSLAVEEQFYLILPFLIRYVRDRKLLVWLGVMIVAAPLSRASLRIFYSHPEAAVLTLMPCRADALMLGVGAAYVLRKEKARRWLNVHRRWLYAALLVLCLGMAWMASHSGANEVGANSLPAVTGADPPTQTPSDPSPYALLKIASSSLNYTWIALFYLCVLMIAVTQRSSLLSRLLRVGPLMSIGLIAYGTYLFHQVILGLYFAFFNGRLPGISSFADFGITILALFATLALAAASWVYFEKPLVRRGHKYRYQSTNGTRTWPFAS